MSARVTPTSDQPGRLGSAGRDRLAAALSEAARLTERDRLVLDLLAEHQVMTADQLARCCFPNSHRARHRLLPLVQRDVLARFRCYTPGRGGSAPFIYALGLHGAAIRAAAIGEPLPKPGDIRRRLLRLQQSASLKHRLGVTDFFSRLTEVAHGTRHMALTAWWSEHTAAKACGDIVRPDGYGEWSESGTVTGFFLEHDRGTESLPVLLDKIDRYTALATAGIGRPVLISLPNSARETNLHRAFSQRIGRLTGPSAIVIATTHRELLDTHDGPAGPIWWPAGATTRYRLTTLGSLQSG